MSITLSDIKAAVASYVDSEVTVTLSDVEPDSGTLNPAENGRFTVTVSNAPEPDGVRLRDVTLHLTTTKPGKAKLKVPSGAAVFARSTLDETDPRLPTGSLVEEMFITYLSGTLEVGEEIVLGIDIRGLNEGSGEVTCHVHAEVDQDSLFPTNEHGPTASVGWTVV